MRVAFTHRVRRVASIVLGVSLLASSALATTVKELVRFKGQGEVPLTGMGLVVGLPGTGDSGKEALLARPLMEVYRSHGMGGASPRELSAAKAVALVTVSAVIPASGALADDRIDLRVQAVHNASSLKGGELFLVAMKGPFPTSPVYALGQGVVDLPDSSSPTAGVVRGGARMLRDVAGPEVPDIFELIIDPHFSGWAAASQIATAINSRAQPQGPSVAVAVDERTIRVSIPEAERGDRAAFLADVMGAEVNSSLLDLPAQVIVNSRTGAIVVTGDVEISPVAITHKDLNITTTRPTPVPSAQNPLIERQRWADVRTSSKPSENAKLADLLTAFKSLDIPVTEQIAILQMLHKTGKLQARLVVD